MKTSRRVRFDPRGPAKKLYPTPETVWYTVDGRLWVTCPRGSCSKGQMRRRAGLYECRTCKTLWELQE